METKHTPGPWNLPEFCYAVMIGDPEQAILIKRGDSGYRPYTKGHPPQVEAFVNDRNELLGVTPAQREAMIAGSMFGWHTPGADPSNYDAEGRPIPMRRRAGGR